MRRFGSFVYPLAFAVSIVLGPQPASGQDYKPSVESTAGINVSVARKQARATLRSMQEEGDSGASRFVRVGYENNAFDITRSALTPEGMELDLGRGRSWGSRAGTHHKYSVTWRDIGDLTVRPKTRSRHDEVVLPRLTISFFNGARDARAFADALFVLSQRHVPGVAGVDDREFEAMVAKYREAGAKPEFPEAARRFRVQAEAAVQAKEYDDAADFYAEALKIAPWWPEGRFNRALILGELKGYAEAMAEMKRFLALEPTHAQARAAQDKIYEWEGKIRR